MNLRLWNRLLSTLLLAPIVAATPAGMAPAAGAPTHSQVDQSAELLLANRLDAQAVGLDGAGRYSDAQPLFERALAIRRRILGDDHPDTAKSCQALANNLENQSRYSDAQPLFARALEIRRRILGGDHPDTATSYNDLALNFNDQGRHAEAQPLFEKALDIRLRVLGENNPDTAESYNDLAGNLGDQGRFADAQLLYEKSLDIRRHVLGENHKDTATTYNDMAFNLHGQGRYAEAQSLYERALDIYRVVLGEDHPYTAQAYDNVARSLYDQGRYRDAQPLFDKSLEIRRHTLGEVHVATAQSYNNVANNLDRQGRLTDALAMHEKALDICRRVIGENHPFTAASYSSLASNLSLQGRFAEAQPLYQAALDIRRRTLGDDHPDTAQSYGSVGYVLDSRGLSANAEPYLAKALDVRQRVLGGSHPDTAMSYNNLAANLAAQGRYTDAQSLYLMASEIWRRSVGDGHPGLIVSLGNQAFNLLDAGRPSDALAPARAAASQLRVRRAAALGNDEAQQLRDARAATDFFILLDDALWSAYASDKRAAVTNEAFQSLQDCVASSAGAAVAQMGARFNSGDDTLRRLARERQDLDARWSANDSALARALGGSEPGATARVDTLHADTARVRHRLEEIDAELKRSFPAYFDLIRPDALPGEEVQALLMEGEAVLVVVPGPRGTHVIGVSKTRMSWTRSDWDTGQVLAAVRRLRCGLDLTHCTGAPATDSRGMARTDTPTPRKHAGAFDRRLAFDLYQQVVAPVMPVLTQARNVYVVTSGTLSSLPFSVLVTEPPKSGEDDADPQVLRNTPWLLRQFAITALPSVASLKALRAFQGPARTADTKYDFFGVGDPVVGTGSSAAVGRGPTRASSLFHGIAANGAGLADPQALRESFAALPGTRVELEGMQRAFAPRSEILLGPRATETAVKSTPLEGVSVVAFSTHGLIAGDIDGIAEPGLVLTPPTTATIADDGLLTATEVAQLKLSADWVLLSACNTASSDGTPGADALSGLARAFFYAGARSLMVSHWPVRDDVASQLTVDAIRRHRAHPELGRAEALRQATLAVLDGSAHGDASLAQPAAWAPFSLVGEGN